MKSQIARIKNRARSLSTRTLAVMLCFVMLLTAVGAGTMMTAFANGAAGDSNIADAAQKLVDIANAVDTEAADKADNNAKADEGFMPKLSKKIFDLAETGATYYIWKAEGNSGSSSSNYTCLGTSPQTFSATTGKNYYIAISTSGTDIFSGTVWLTGADVSGVSTSAVGTQGFDGKQAVRFAMSSADTVKVSYSSGSKIKIEKGTASSSCTNNHKMIVTGDQQLTNTTNWQNTWSGAGTRNQMTYNSAIGKYEIKYTNIDASSSSSNYFRFRILDLTTKGDPDTSWETDKGYAQGSGAITDASSILQGTSKTTAGADNTFQFSLKQKANITIYLDDSKLGTNSAIEVIVNPAVSTVTAGSAKVGSTVTPAAGTITITNGTNVAYGGTVTLTATAGTDYVFSQWEDNSDLTYTNKNAASTTATVTGSTTVNAIFVPKSYMVNKGTGTGFTITAPSSNQSKQWGTSVAVTAKSDNLHYVDYLYYKVNDEGNEVKITNGAAGAGTTSSLTGSFAMPKNNVTVYAHVHEKGSQTVKYTADQTGGYVSVGRRHSTSATQIEQSYYDGDKVIQGTKVNFCAIPKNGYRFVGWYTDSTFTTAAAETGANITVTAGASGNLARYAKFESLDVGTTKTRLLFKSLTNLKYHWWNDSGTPNSTWPGKAVSEYPSVTLNGNTYYLYDTTDTDGIGFILNTDGDNNKSGDQSIPPGGGTYVLSYNNSTKKVSQTKWADFTVNASSVFPVHLDVVNPEKAYNSETSTYVNAYATKSTSVSVYVQPKDATSKANIKSVNESTSAQITNEDYLDTTAGNKSFTMPSNAPAKVTVTYKDKDYYKVTFSAGAGGTVTATAGGKAITSGTPVMEDTSVTITATPNSGYAVSGWTGKGDITTSSTDESRTFTISQDTEAKAYFKAGKGTENDATWFGYGTTNDPYYWTFSKTYVRDGHVWAYIDSVSSTNTYYIGAYNVEPDETWEKYKEMFYFNNSKNADPKPWASTEFKSYISNIGRDDEKYYGDDYGTGYCRSVKFNVSSAVKALIIDLGPDDGNGKAQTHSADANHKFLANNYRIIPVFNNEFNKVSVYAKDASYRNNSEYDYLPGIANTVITEDTNVTGRVEHDEFETAVATKGQNITVTTTVDPDHRGRYYVRGFSVNGVTPELYEYKSNGVYSMTYTIPADFDDNYLEITPIYAEYGVTNVRFYIENYDEAFQNTGWGNTLAVYPFYENASGSYAETKHNAFGGYPGQPVINNGGRRFIEVPTNYTTLTVDGTTEVCHVKGVTLSNDYFDIVHRDYCREVDDHLQTYDYDDFYKIYKETSDGKEVNGKTTAADQITFAFKYRTATNNFADSSNTVTYSTTGKTVHAPYSSFTAAQKDSKFKNGWEPLLDYHDRPIDLFGKQLSSADQTKEPLLVVSDDYAITYAGRYATTWTVYRKNGTNYTKIAEIAPSALIVATKARLGTGTYPAVTDKTGFPSTTGHKLADYSDEYQALKAYADTPVQITYESAIRNNSSYEKYWSMTGGSSEVAKRSDGRWFYSYQGEIINADLRIDYTDEYKGEENTTWTTDSYNDGTNTGEVTGATLHFTNTASDAEGGNYELTPYHDTADYDHDIVSNFNHYYKFEATEGSGYIFIGWYMERDGVSTAVNSDDIKKLTGKSQMTSNATFVARYVKNPAGHITINHTMDDGSTGTGTTYIGIEKSNDGTTWTWITGDGTDHYVRADKVSVNDPDVMSYNSGYTLRVTLKTVVAADTAFDRFSANNDEHSPNYFSSNVTTSGTTSTTSFEVPVDDLFQIVDGFPKQQFDSLTYFSHTTKRPELTISHSIDPTSDSTAEGTPYLKVEVLSAANSVVATYGGEETDGYAKGKDLVVPSTYYNGTDDYRIKVYLKTEMKGFTQFDHFSILGYVITNAPGPNGETITLSSSTDQRTMFATATFSASACYNRGERVLPYLSKLIVPDYKYQLKYTYPSYVNKEDNQSYTAKDSFAPEELTEYMTLNNGDLAFQNDAKKLSFICKKAPYEDNYQKKLDFSKHSTITGRGYSSDDNMMKLDISVTAENEQLSAYFDFPYATTQDNEFKPVVTDGKVIKTDPNRRGKTDIYGRDWFVTNDVRNEGINGTPEFVKAPLIIHDNSSNKDLYFKYWSVETEGTANNASREYTRCYDYEFNLAIFQNCIITPEYDETDFATRGMAAPVPDNYGTNPQSSGYDRFDPDVNRDYYRLDDNGVSITFIENSRNQYNNGDSGNAPANRNGAADRIYSDFLLTFDTEPKKVLKDEYGDTKQAGLIIQPVAYLEKDDKGNYKVDSDTYYGETTKYNGATPAQIKSYLEGTTSINGLIKSQFGVSSLDNKNRLQYYYGFDNAVAKTKNDDSDSKGIINVGSTYRNQRIVYKAFAYIGDGNSTGNLTNVTVSAHPVYFTIYTAATIAPGFYMPDTTPGD